VGLSGLGIMSGLAAAAATVGSGAMGALAALSVAPGMISVGVMNVALRDGPALPSTERTARNVGRKASVVGAAGGGAAGLAALSAAGVVASVIGVGITSGLAAIGRVVGGGMAAGTGIVIAGPSVAAAGDGYGDYRVTRAVKDHTSSDNDRTMRGVLSRGNNSARRSGDLVASRAKIDLWRVDGAPCGSRRRSLILKRHRSARVS
jgi:hypothetical protein